MRYWTWLLKRVIFRIPTLTFNALKVTFAELIEKESGVEFTSGCILLILGTLIILLLNQPLILIPSWILSFILLTHSFYLDEVESHQ